GQYGITDLTVTTFFLLPPIMTSCNEKGQLVAQIGDLFVDATMNLFEMPTQFSLYTSVEAELSISVNQGEQGPEIAFKLGDISTFEMQFVKVSENFVGQEASLESLIKDLLITQLLQNIGDLPGFPIPAIDLSALSPDIPPGTTITLEPEELTRIMGYTVIVGKLLVGKQ
ncbi:MAG: hypothetical protein FJ088_11100, partial [Deltaproteobacteria bacterium]|nr:hypothetical protein [Deltaproteobacteria bacterium]